MVRYDVTGNSVTDLSALAAVLQSLVTAGRTELFDTVTLNEAGTVLTLSKDGAVLFVWDNASSGSYAQFDIYVGDGAAVSVTNNTNRCPTFLIDLGSCIYIGRANTYISSAGHTQYTAIVPAGSGTAFVLHNGTSSGNFGQNVFCIAYGDMQNPAAALSWTPNTGKNALAYYPLPTNCPIDGENYTIDCFALAYNPYALTAQGKTEINGIRYYTNGYLILRDRSGEA